MNPVVVFLLFSTSLGTPFSANPGQSVDLRQPDLRIRVKVEVTAREEVRTAMSGYMAQEFNALANVQLVEDDPRWTVKIVTLAVEGEEGRLSALGFSVVVLEHGPQMNLLRMLTRAWHYIIKERLLQKDQRLEVEMRELMAGVARLPKTDDLTVLSQHRMCVVPAARLGEACHDIVADLNTRFLQRSAANHNTAVKQSNAAGMPVVSP